MVVTLPVAGTPLMAVKNVQDKQIRQSKKWKNVERTIEEKERIFTDIDRMM